MTVTWAHRKQLGFSAPHFCLSRRLSLRLSLYLSLIHTHTHTHIHTTLCTSTHTHNPFTLQFKKSQLLRRFVLNAQDSIVVSGRVIMSPFCESVAKMTAPPLPETTMHTLTSSSSIFYKSHAWPWVCAAPSFPGQPGSLGLPLNFALGRETFLLSFLCERCFS
jgi:hypothetical protein